MTTLPQKLSEVSPVSDATYCQRAVALKKNIEVTFLVLGEMLKNIRDEKRYEGTYTDFEEFLEDLNLTASNASKIITVFEYFCENLKVPEDKLVNAGGYSVLYELYILSKSEADQKSFVDEKLSMLASPMIGGRQKYLRELKNGVEACEHAWKDLHIRQCSNCYVKEKLYPPEGATSL